MMKEVVVILKDNRYKNNKKTKTIKVNFPDTLTESEKKNYKWLENMLVSAKLTTKERAKMKDYIIL